MSGGFDTSVSGYKFDFNSLHDVAGGTYNMGEVDIKRNDSKGTISFGKINNHVSLTSQNNKMRTEAQNRAINTAVFMTIAEHYGRHGEDADALAGLQALFTGANKEESSVVAALGKFSNPYILETFKFLLASDGACAGRPLSRDELKSLLEMLDDYDKEIPAKDPKVKFEADKDKVKRLETLHAFKSTGALPIDEDGTKKTYRDVTGYGETKAGSSKRRAVMGVTVNQQQFQSASVDADLKPETGTGAETQTVEQNNQREQPKVEKREQGNASSNMTTGVNQTKPGVITVSRGKIQIGKYSDKKHSLLPPEGMEEREISTGNMDGGKVDETKKVTIANTPVEGKAPVGSAGVTKAKGIDKTMVPLDDDFKMTAEIKKFLKDEQETYKAMNDEAVRIYEETLEKNNSMNPGKDKKSIKAKNDADKEALRNLNSKRWEWKLQLAQDPKYQEKVLRIWGDRLEPISLKNFGLDIDRLDDITFDPPKEDLTVVGEGQGVGATALTSKKKHMMYQNCADVTHPAGTVLDLGQEEGLAKDWPPYMLAYFIKKGYVEVSQDGVHLNYVRDVNSVPKINTWLGCIFPCVTYSVEGNPTAEDEFRITPYFNTGATSFGANARANTDMFGFQTHLQNRVGAPKLDVNDEKMLSNQREFHKELTAILIGAGNKKYPNYKEYSYLLKPIKYGYGYEGSHKCQERNAAAFIAHNCSAKWGFDVYGDNPKKEVAKLLAIIKKGKYKELMNEAIANYQKTQARQHKAWAVLLKMVGAKDIVTADPGIGFFFGPFNQTIESLGGALATWAGSALKRICLKFDSTFNEKLVKNSYKRKVK